MKQYILQLTTASLLVMCLPAQAQHYTFGIDEGINRSTQLFSNPGLPLDGTTQLNSITGWHAGVFVSAQNMFHNKVLDFFTYKARLSYIRKGASQPVRIYGGPLYLTNINGVTQVAIPENNQIRNTLDYVSLDLTFQKHFLHFGRKSSLFAEVGIGNNLLVSSDIKTGYTDALVYNNPYSSYDDRHVNRYNITWIAGAGINFENKFNLFVQSSKGLSPVHYSGNLRVKDWSWIFGASITLASGKSVPKG